MLKEPRQPLMVKAGEELAKIRVEHPIHALSSEPNRERIQRVMRGAPRSKPVRTTKKVRLIYGVQHLDHRPLKELVFQRSDPERPSPPIGLRYVHPPPRSRPVAP